MVDEVQERLKEEFTERFGIEGWEALKGACKYHIESGAINKEFRGNFAQVVLITLGFQCVEVPEYREFHGIPFGWEEFKEWLIEHRDEILKMEVTDNDVDFMGMACGDYSFLLKNQEQ